MNLFILVDDLNLRILVLSSDSLIKLFDIRNKLWNYLLKILKWPCFKSLCKDSVVCICTCLADYVDSFVNIKCLFLNKNSDKLRNDHCWVSIIDLDHSMFVKLMKIVLTLLLLTKNKLCSV